MKMMQSHNAKRYLFVWWCFVFFTISPFCSVPTSLQNITVTPINGSTILVSWNPLSPVEARGYVRYYLVTWTPSSSKARGTAGSANLTADATMFLITGLDPMVTYTISVSTGTSAGVGAASNTTAMTPGRMTLYISLPYQSGPQS